MVNNQTGPRVGYFAKSSFDGRDYSIINIDDNAKYRFENNSVRVPFNRSVNITGTADPVVGARSARQDRPQASAAASSPASTASQRFWITPSTTASPPTSASCRVTAVARSSPERWQWASRVRPTSPPLPCARSLRQRHCSGKKPRPSTRRRSTTSSPPTQAEGSRLLITRITRDSKTGATPSEGVRPFRRS